MRVIAFDDVEVRGVHTGCRHVKERGIAVSNRDRIPVSLIEHLLEICERVG